ncbi:FumA C-terminus/TtdB family hydratase beta subunit [Methanobacterium sp. BAmetb5]|uniref:FumA C-terminus/TtdB family hydratase beta subunit n=1 Tax=Methanobacterium sp. BAmetb5 TaxID=2025351 RepID=UPI000E859B15|nr:FumA C-terminus/TtdB family hydratase beta subunit [Methanobacterium sp. BAmetb5]AXV38804.1 MAG: fumarate hydratase [Methanobacterium sp. BAmetb5]
MIVHLETPLKREDTQKLRIKDSVYISGTIYTARDSAHKRIIESGSPVTLEGAVIFHAGPIIKQEGEDYHMVAVGPTTSTRMNPYQAEVLDQGAQAVIGKGGMDDNTAEALKRNGAVFLAAVGGCAALYVSSVVKIKGVHWLDLGVPEAVWELEVKDFGPLIVTMDSVGSNLYQEARKKSNPQG